VESAEPPHDERQEPLEQRDGELLANIPELHCSNEPSNVDDAPRIGRIASASDRPDSLSLEQPEVVCKCRAAAH
jgi:hypothetical protein